MTATDGRGSPSSSSSSSGSSSSGASPSPQQRAQSPRRCDAMKRGAVTTCHPHNNSDDRRRSRSPVRRRDDRRHGDDRREERRRHDDDRREDRKRHDDDRREDRRRHDDDRREDRRRHDDDRREERRRHDDDRRENHRRRHEDDRLEDHRRRRDDNDRGQHPRSDPAWRQDTVEPQPQPEGEDEPYKEPERDFGLSGKLAEETNMVNGVVVNYHEPPEAAKPTLRWRLYTFKNGQSLGEPLQVHRQSAYLFGREAKVADVRTDHPSCSKQHAVLQFRQTEKIGQDGMPVPFVRPYLMDLGSTNGTFLNGDKVEPQRYYELLEKDVLVFGSSTREFVLLHERSGGKG